MALCPETRHYPRLWKQCKRTHLPNCHFSIIFQNSNTMKIEAWNTNCENRTLRSAFSEPSRMLNADQSNSLPFILILCDSYQIHFFTPPSVSECPSWRPLLIADIFENRYERHIDLPVDGNFGESNCLILLHSNVVQFILTFAYVELACLYPMVSFMEAYDYHTILLPGFCGGYHPDIWIFPDYPKIPMILSRWFPTSSV